MKNIYLFTLLIASIHLHATDPEEQLENAVKNGNLTEIKRLLNQENIDINTTNYWRSQSILHYAALNDNADITEYLITKGCRHVNTPNTWDLTPLHFAASMGNRKTVIILLQNGADSKIKNASRETPANKAIKNGFPELAQLIDNWQDMPDTKEPDVES